VTGLPEAASYPAYPYLADLLSRTPSLQLLLSLTAAALASATAACGDSTDPGAHIDVTVGVTRIVGPNVDQAPRDGNRVACEVSVFARATGKGRANWGAATFKWFGGKDRSAPLDSAVAPAVDVRRAWSDSSILAGARQTATWNVWASLPFSGTIDFRYSVGAGKDRTASVAYDCGPPIVAGADPPSITDISTQSLTPDLEPGGVLNVAYTATSALGVWHTAVLVSGPCELYQEFDEPLAKTVSRTVPVQIPADCEPGAPVDVTVYATDAVLDRRARQVSSTYILVDKTRPSIRGATLARPSGPYFTGDTIDFVVNASDNHVVKSIVWEARPFGAVDSIVSPARGADVKVRIPVRSNWSGPIELRYFARDAAGLVSDTIVSSAGTTAVYPTVVRPVRSTGSDESADGSIDEAVDVARGLVYLMQQTPRRIAVMSLASMQVVSTISLALAPGNIDLTASGDSLLVSLPELAALGVIDLRRAEPRLEIMTVDPGSDQSFNPYPVRSVSEVRALSNGKAFLVVSSDFGARRLAELDLATGVARYRFDAGIGAVIAGFNVEGAVLARSGDRSIVSVRGADCLQRYDVVTDRFAPCTQTETLGVVSSVDAAGQRFAIGPDLYDASWLHLRRVEMLPAGTGLGGTLTPDGRELYVPYAGSVVRASTIDGRILDRQLPSVRPGRLRVSPDGKFLVVVGRSVATGDAEIAVIDLR
jgi:hypothetical protein